VILQERDIEVLSYLARYFILTAAQIRELCFPDDTTGRVTRRRLNKMVHDGFARRRQMQVVNPLTGAASPVYHLTADGRSFLAAHFDDELLLQKPVEPSQPQHLFHYAAVSETHRLFDRALTAANGEVQLKRWINEDEIVNPEEPDKKNRHLLRTAFEGDRNLVCLPDGAIVLQYQDQKAVFYLEQDRDTYFHDRVAARKSPGYRELLLRVGHKKHFPETTLPFFYVLFVAPNSRRRDQLRLAFQKKNEGHDAQKIYRFMAFDEAQNSNLFFDPLCVCCHHDNPVSMIQRS
jgi:hypothetical protein